MTMRKWRVAIRGLVNVRFEKFAAVLFLFFAVAVIPGRASAVDELEYPVQQGDTLIGLSERLLIDSHDWVKLQRINQVKDPRRIPVGTILRIPFSLLKIELLSAEITAVEGEAFVNGRPAEVGMQVEAGTKMATGDNGYLALKLPDGSLMTLPARSSTHIDTLQHYPGLEGQDFNLRLERGRVESRTKPQRGPAARYRVDTPTAVIGVRGTDFRVGYDPLQTTTRTETTHGAVGVNTSAQTRKRREHIVNAGFGVVADADGRLSPAELLSAPDLTNVPELFDRPVVRFKLPRVDHAAAVRVQVVRNEEEHSRKAVLFDELIAFSGASSVDVRIQGLEDGVYRLRIRAVAVNGLEGHDAEGKFRLEARPEPPFLSHPFTDSKIGAGKISLQWAQAPTSGRYAVEVTDHSDFTGALIYQEERAEPFAIVDLKPGHYRWRVASLREDGSRGPFSDAASFETRAAPDMGEVVTNDENKTMQYSWSGEPGQRFDYQFATDSIFNNVLIEGNSDVPSVTLQRPVPDTYWLRVRAIDPDGFVGPWSAPQKVVVASRFPWWMLVPLIVVL